MTYLLDANVFIAASRGHFAFDITPGFWDWLDDAHAQGIVASVQAVRDELTDSDDKLAEWAQARPAFFHPPDADAAASLRQLSTWVDSHDPPYTDAARAEFLGDADYFLVGQAHSGKLTVVTHERRENTPTKVKIPNACEGLGVACVTPFAMLRTEGVRFGVAP